MKATAVRVWEWAKVVGAEWWEAIGDAPRPHFVSMVFGIALYFAIKFAVWLAT